MMRVPPRAVSMRLALRLLIGAAVLGYSLPVSAACTSHLSDFSDFGVAALGDPVSRLPDGAKHFPDCKKINEDVGCELYVWQGIGYEVVGKKIYGKYVFADESFGPVTPPFGFSNQNTAADVIRKIAAHKGGSHRSSLLYNSYGHGDQVEVGPSGMCLHNRRGFAFVVAMKFGENHRLMGLEASKPDNDGEED
jgi:hypothetical protein